MSKEITMENQWEPVIGLEVHVQLNSKTKMFSSCNWSYGESPNTLVCPTTLGYPGSLPTINMEAVKLGIALGLGLKCKINKSTGFSRKHYYYPDLPKGYQITQFNMPLCESGYVYIDDDQINEIGITRAHLEEDAGKTIHSLEGHALIDFNRAGAPLIEVVSEPDIRNSSQALMYLSNLKQIIQYTGASDCDMEKGNLRVDLNISMRPFGQKEFGVRREVKNLNSFRSVEKAIEFEINYQSAILDSGGFITQETLLWDEINMSTHSIRSKEDAHDYRFFPEPDLPDLSLSDEMIDQIKSEMPEMPYDVKNRIMEKYKLSSLESDLLVSEYDIVVFFENICELGSNPMKVYNWISGEVLRVMKEKKCSLDQISLNNKEFSILINMVENDEITLTNAKKVFSIMIESDDPVKEIVSKHDLGLSSNTESINDFIKEVFLQNPEEEKRFLKGELKLKNFFIGHVMRATKGKFNAADISKALEQIIDKN